MGNTLTIESHQMPTNQQHSGAGDNVAGNKVVNVTQRNRVTLISIAYLPYLIGGAMLIGLLGVLYFVNRYVDRKIGDFVASKTGIDRFEDYEMLHITDAQGVLTLRYPEFFGPLVVRYDSARTNFRAVLEQDSLMGLSELGVHAAKLDWKYLDKAQWRWLVDRRLAYEVEHVRKLFPGDRTRLLKLSQTVADNRIEVSYKITFDWRWYERWLTKEEIMAYLDTYYRSVFEYDEGVYAMYRYRLPYRVHATHQAAGGDAELIQVDLDFAALRETLASSKLDFAKAEIDILNRRFTTVQPADSVAALKRYLAEKRAAFAEAPLRLETAIVLAFGYYQVGAYADSQTWNERLLAHYPKHKLFNQLADQLAKKQRSSLLMQ